jgi:ubiquinol-cytochrome c reductase core subunit 2
LTAEFLPADAPFFVDVLTSFVTSAKFTRHEFEEYVAPLVEAETEATLHDPATRAINAAHALAFRSGLGQSLFAPEHPDLVVEDVKAFASQAFSKGNIAVVGTGIDQATLSSLVEKGFASASAGSSVSSPATQYFGGETRIDAHGPQTVFIGFGTAGAPSSGLAALAAHLSTTPSVKWSKGLSPLAAVSGGASVQTVYLPYSDATLFGLLVQGSTATAVKESAKAAVAALKSASRSIKAEELQAAIAKAKFSAASALETREGLVAAIGPKLFSGSDASLTSTFSSLEKVDAAGLSKAAASLVSAKPTYVVVGDSSALPYADEVGL